MNRLQQLHKRLEQGLPQECLEWWGGKISTGYASIRTKEGHILGHRAALEWKINRKLSAEEIACHTCDNPGCVNPLHLYAGTAKTNSQDMYTRGRNVAKPCRGETHKLSKLTADKVKEIRASNEIARVLADRYGVGKTLIHNIKSNKTWRHV